MKLLIVTGMSGAGKSQTAHALEDIGFYCVDNIPPSIIPSFVDLSDRTGGELEKLAVVTDTRGGQLFSSISDVLDGLKKAKVDYKILFLDSSDEVLEKRYKENRRKHPLCEADDLSVTAAIKRERKLLEKIRGKADYIVDTSNISAIQLKSRLSDLFFGNTNNGFKIQCMSFGFKYGPATEADLMFDVRCLPNPFYLPELKAKSGLDKEVKDFVLTSRDGKKFTKRLTDLIDCAVPLYSKEGKSQLIIAFGCTGGRHRSVTYAEYISEHLKELGYDCVSVHRDIKKTV